MLRRNFLQSFSLPGIPLTKRKILPIDEIYQADLTPLFLPYLTRLRQKFQLEPLTPHTASILASAMQAENMARTGKEMHNIPELGLQGEFAERLFLAGVTDRAVEEISLSTDRPKKFVQNWIKDIDADNPAINPEFRHYGVVYAAAINQPDEHSYAMVFST